MCFPQPIPVDSLLVEDLPDGDVRMGGSFKTAISRLAAGELFATGKWRQFSAGTEKPDGPR